ncbi:MAG: hypothetical protein Q9220_005015 [cf. Caloplaca sp. 1 TL-2023]
MGRLNYTNVKRIPPGTGSKSALRDPVVELDITGKTLGDDGFQEIADALATALAYDGEQGRVLLLEELCIKSNGLSTTCLPALARVIRLAASDLRDLDISDNAFTITTRQDAKSWEDFLESFRGCIMLRRLDLSGNNLDPKAFEVLARVYTREPIIELGSEDEAEDLVVSGTPSRRNTTGDIAALNRQLRNFSLGSRPGARADVDDNVAISDRKVSHGSRHDSKSPEAMGSVSLRDDTLLFTKTQGLRSVPYIILSKTGMTDICALHLSYLLASHHATERLLRHVPPAKPGHHVQLLESYDDTTGCHGIIHLPNSNIGSAGVKVLELSENVRRLLHDDDRLAESPEVNQMQFRKFSFSRNTSSSHPSPCAAVSEARMRNGMKGVPEEVTDREDLTADLDRARSRIQGNILRDAGVQSNDLWTTALRMLVMCRILCPMRREENPAPPTVARKGEATRPVPVQPTVDTEYPTLPRVHPRPFIGYLDHSTPSFATKIQTMPTTPTPTTKKQPLRLQTTTTPSPFSITSVTPSSTTLVSPTNTTALPAATTTTYRSDLPRGLPEVAWTRIMGLYLRAGRFMSERQQTSVFRWAVDRRTLARELENLGKPESAQVWKVLEGTGCLAYEGDF